MLVVLAATFLLWAPLVVVTGGFGFRVGPLNISSRRPRNGVVIALVLLAVAWAIAPPARRTEILRGDFTWLTQSVAAWGRRTWRAWLRLDTILIARLGARAALAAAFAIAGLVVVIGFEEGALVAAGADASGYVSQADLWARGALRVEPPLMRELTTQIPADAFAPLAYRPSPDGAAIVPIVAPGLPMVMALFQLAGGRDAVFLVLPLMAGMAIVVTWTLGSRLAGPWSGTAAAALLASSPSFLFQLTSSPMSDIPAMMWWALSLALLIGHGPPEGGPYRALGSGLAAAAGILTRTNLVVLLVIPGTWLLFDLWRERAAPRAAVRRLALFGAGVAPAFAIVAALNDYWLGAPLNSGYGSLEQLFDVAYIGPNLARYPRWMLESQTPLVLLALVAPRLVRRRGEALMLLAFAVGVVACYIAYAPFDAWWFLRFLLPAYPPILALTTAAVVWGATRLPAGLRIIAATAVIGVAAWHGVTYAAAHASFDSEGEWKYAEAGRYAADHLPPRSVLLASQHSGSARYYTGMVTLRWEWIPPDKLDWVLAEIARHGYVPYALLEDWEEPPIRERFAGRRGLEAFSRRPLAELPLGNVRIYDLRPR